MREFMSTILSLNTKKKFFSIINYGRDCKAKLEYYLIETSNRAEIKSSGGSEYDSSAALRVKTFKSRNKQNSIQIIL
jgi:hypothetical protein